ncbi:ROK family protein [Thermaurantiacus tibetensis]|uniref:glucokinase n=1 Tax=Thermaurantiacus tibetensis TaxID=2759035 RepID=UPI00188E69A5|nr:ROK family protein [Thermaurantiacus tibetensis]
MTLLVGDIGGTHARFAVARRAGAGVALGPVVRLQTGSFPGLAEALEAARAGLGQRLPRRAAIAVAAAVGDGPVTMPNAGWAIAAEAVAARLGLARLDLLNDVEAAGHAVLRLGPAGLAHVSGPAVWPARGVISLVAPGTGLGAALLLADPRRPRVLATEAGHIGFAPADAFEDSLVAALRKRFGRVSAERLASGPGLAAIHGALAATAGAGTPAAAPADAATLWEAARDGRDPLAAEALERWLAILGAVAGDLALAHGAQAVVLGGGIASRLGARLAAPAFRTRFLAKGRFAGRMERLPLFRITHPEPALLGAALAGFALARAARAMPRPSPLA